MADKLHEPKYGDLVTLKDIEEARSVVNDSICVKTPMINATSFFDGVEDGVQLYLKLENMQTAGKTYMKIQELIKLPK